MLGSGHGAFQVEHGISSQAHPVVLEEAGDIAASRRRLSRPQRRLFQSGGPKLGRQRAMGGTGDRVLWNTGLRSKEARNEIDVVARFPGAVMIRPMPPRAR